MDASMFNSCLLSCIWAFLIALFAIPSIIYIAHEKNLLDTPNERTVHKSLKPRMGGLAIFAGFISALTIFGDFSEEFRGIQQVLAGSVIIFFIGLKDDIAGVSAFKKFFVQILATGIVVFIGELRITNLHGIMGINVIENDGLSYAITFFIIIGITNAVNLIDGLDGLAGSVVTVMAIAFGVYFYQFNSSFAVLSFCLAGSMLGFLRFNIYRATIFMGDTGSLVSGFVIAVMAVQFVEMAPANSASPITALAILILPVVDTLRVFMLRISVGISPFTPDKNHIHHRLIDLGFSHIQTVGILVLVNLIFIGSSVYLSTILSANKLMLIIVAAALILSLILELVTKKLVKA